MSKAHMIVLGFLNERPMYGYRIGQLLDDRHLSVWDIKLPSIYKAMQTLEEKGYIDGEQMVEGNNPPRTVYSLNSKGIQYLKQLIREALNTRKGMDREFWLALSFARKCITRSELKTALEQRLKQVEELLDPSRAEEVAAMIRENQLPIIHRHLFTMGKGHLEQEQKTMQELYNALDGPEYDSFFSEE